MKLTFDFKDGNYDLWLARASELQNKLHGKRMKVILGNDSFYYEGRVSVSTEKINKYYSSVEITVNRDPYKSTSKWNVRICYTRKSNESDTGL